MTKLKAGELKKQYGCCNSDQNIKETVTSYVDQECASQTTERTILLQRRNVNTI